MFSTKYVVSKREQQICTLKIHVKNQYINKDSVIFIKKLSYNFLEVFVGDEKFSSTFLGFLAGSEN